jgi:hypothetical protein
MPGYASRRQVWHRLRYAAVWNVSDIDLNSSPAREWTARGSQWHVSSVANPLAARILARLGDENDFRLGEID